jgi:hypothetical protein
MYTHVYIRYMCRRIYIYMIYKHAMGIYGFAVHVLLLGGVCMNEHLRSVLYICEHMHVHENIHAHVCTNTHIYT